MNSQAEIKCKVFEDNSGELTIATLPKMRLRTKYINTKYWHYRENLEQGKISIHPVSTKDQIADLLTKPLPEPDFKKLKEHIMGKEYGESLKGSVEINEGPIPVLKDWTVLGDENWESTKGSRLEQTVPHQMKICMRKAQIRKKNSKGKQCC